MWQRPCWKLKPFWLDPGWTWQGNYLYCCCWCCRNRRSVGRSGDRWSELNGSQGFTRFGRRSGEVVPMAKMQKMVMGWCLSLTPDGDACISAGLNTSPHRCRRLKTLHCKQQSPCTEFVSESLSGDCPAWTCLVRKTAFGFVRLVLKPASAGFSWFIMREKYRRF